ncbi:hypothetical protein AaE_016017, partial [Aphanomyces astaci]
MRPTYTHTLFYLAQLYGHLNAPEKSAMYCQLTLRHQLDDLTNIPRDWVQNCLHLSEYFLKQNQLPKASQCIHACTSVGPQPSEEAQIAANLAKLYIQTLYLAQHDIDLIPDTDVLFPNIRTRETFISPSDIDSFDAARDVFKKAMAALATAKHFAVDSIHYFEKFVQLYYYQQGKSDGLEPLPPQLYVPTHLESAPDLKPFFNGLFVLTRVYGKATFQDDAKTVRFWTK